MPATEVELDNSYKALQRVFDVWHWQKSLWMSHEAVICQYIYSLISALLTDFVILSSIDLSSRMNVGNVTLLRSAPGLNCAIMCESTVVKSQPLSSFLNSTS